MCQHFKKCPDDEDFQDYLIKSFAALANYSLPFTLEMILDLLIKYEIDEQIGHIWSLLDKSFVRGITFERALAFFSKTELFVNDLRLRTAPFTKSWVMPFSDFVSLLVTDVIMKQGLSMENIDSAETSFLKMYQSWIFCNPELSPPWNKSPGDIEIASKFLSTFFCSLNMFLQLTHYVGMTKLWRFLTMDTRLVACVPATHIHIQNTFFEALNNSKIEWGSWYPILEDVEYITSLVQYLCVLPQESISEHLIKFLCIIACDVRWENRDFMEDHRLPRFQELFIRWNALSLLCKPINEDLRKRLSSRSLEMNWNSLPPDTYACILNDITDILTKIKGVTGFEAGTRCNNMIKFLATTCGCYDLIEDGLLEREIQAQKQRHSVSISTCANRFYSFVKLFVASLDLGLPTQEFSSLAIRGIINISTNLSQNTFADQALEELFKLLNKSKTRQLVSDGLNKSIELHPKESLSILNIIFKAVTDPSTLVQEGESILTFFFMPSTQSKVYGEGAQNSWEDVLSSIPSSVIESENVFLPIIDAAATKGTGLFLFAFTQKLIMRNKDFNPGTMVMNFCIPKDKEHIFILVVLSALEKIHNGISEDPNDWKYIKAFSMMEDVLSKKALDRKKEGLTGLLGFGQLSEYAPSFRLFVKIISLFIKAQIMNNGRVRTQPGDAYGDNYTVSMKNMKSLSYVLRDRNYTKEMKPNIMSDILRDSEQLLGDKNTTIKTYDQLLRLLVHNIYPNKLELILAFDMKKK